MQHVLFTELVYAEDITLNLSVACMQVMRSFVMLSYRYSQLYQTFVSEVRAAVDEMVSA